MSKIGPWAGGNVVCSGPSTAQQPCNISATAKLMPSLSFFGKSYLKGAAAECTWDLTVQSVDLLRLRQIKSVCKQQAVGIQII